MLLCPIILPLAYPFTFEAVFYDIQGQVANAKMSQPGIKTITEAQSAKLVGWHLPGWERLIGSAPEDRSLINYRCTIAKPRVLTSPDVLGTFLVCQGFPFMLKTATL